MGRLRAPPLNGTIVAPTSERVMDPADLYNKSLDFLKGQGVEKDEKRSFELNAKAAASGDRDAVLAMGWYYFNGVGVDRDLGEARRWYRKSARQKQPGAMFSLGSISCEEGKYEEAMQWFESAVKEGHTRSIYWIAKLYWRGLGVGRDRRHAEVLLEQAAARRVPEARRVLRFLRHSLSRGRAVQ
jgi:TPR repeat protein